MGRMCGTWPLHSLGDGAMLLIDWLAGLARKTNANRRSSSSPIDRTLAGVVELLEDRTLLSTFRLVSGVVTFEGGHSDIV